MKNEGIMFIEFIELFMLMLLTFVVTGLLSEAAIKIAHKLGLQFEKVEEINTDFITRMHNGEILHASNMFKKN